MPINEDATQEDAGREQSSPQPSKGRGPSQIRFSASASFRAADFNVSTPEPTPVEPFVRDWEVDLHLDDKGHHFTPQTFHHPEDIDTASESTAFPTGHRKITGEFLSVPAFSARQAPTSRTLPLTKEIENPSLPIIILPERTGRKNDIANEAPLRAFGLLEQAISQIAILFPNDLSGPVEEAGLFRMIFDELAGGQITQTQANELIERLKTALRNSSVEEEDIIIDGDEIEIEETVTELPPPENLGASRISRMISQEIRVHNEAARVRTLIAKRILTVIAAVTTLALVGITLRQNTETLPKKASPSSHKKAQPKDLPDLAKEIANLPRPKERTPENKQPVVETQVSTIKQAVAETITSSVTLPIIKEESSSGKVSFNEERSREEWVKLGYSVTVKLAAGGRRYFEVKSSKGNVFEVNIFLVGRNQSTIEGKKLQKDTP